MLAFHRLNQVPVRVRVCWKNISCDYDEKDFLSCSAIRTCTDERIKWNKRKIPLLNNKTKKKEKRWCENSSDSVHVECNDLF